MSKEFIYEVRNDNDILVNRFFVSEDEVKRLQDVIDEIYFKPAGPFSMPYEEVLVHCYDGQIETFNYTPWTKIKSYERGISNANIEAIKNRRRKRNDSE